MSMKLNVQCGYLNTNVNKVNRPMSHAAIWSLMIENKKLQKMTKIPNCHPYCQKIQPNCKKPLPNCQLPLLNCHMPWANCPCPTATGLCSTATDASPTATGAGLTVTGAGPTATDPSPTTREFCPNASGLRQTVRGPRPSAWDYLRPKLNCQRHQLNWLRLQPNSQRSAISCHHW